MLKKTKIIGIAGLLIGLLFYSLNAVAENETATGTPPVSEEVKSQSAVEVPVPQEAAPEEPLEITTGKPDSYYDRRNEADQDRVSVLARSRERYTGPKCEESKECVNLCNIYRYSVRENCTNLPQAQVEKIWDIYKAFENPTYDKLNKIDSEDFQVFVKLDTLDTHPLENLISKFNFLSARIVLIWVADDSDIAETFKNADKEEFDLLKGLLEPLKTTEHPSYQGALGRTIAEGESFIDMAILHEGPAMDWIHGFFEDECYSDYGWELCVLKNWYCQVKLNDYDWDDLFGYEYFTYIVDDILGYPISSPPFWWMDDMEALELTISQLKSLCNLELGVDLNLIIKETNTGEAEVEEIVDTGEVDTTKTPSSGDN